MRTASHRSRFLPLMAALTAAAWLTLWLWGQSPYARYLDHGHWTEIGFAASLCRALPGGGEALTACVVAGGWVLMLSAMMLPTTLPLLDIFRRLTAQRADQRWLISLLVIGYLATWSAFGLAAHLADRAVLFCRGAVRLAGCKRLGNWDGSPDGSRAIPIQPAQIPLSRQVPRAAGVCHRALARKPGEMARPAFGRQARRVLRRLLLGTDAADVRRRHCQYRLDADIGRGYGGREEPPFRPPSRCAAGCRSIAGCVLGCDCGYDELSAHPSTQQDPFQSAYDRIKPSISSWAQFIAASKDWFCRVT